MSRNLFFLIVISSGIIISSGLSSAYAESGPNYDKVLVSENPDGSKTYRSTILNYQRILDGNGQYQDYIFTDAADHLRVETMGLSIKLDKTSCEFSIYESGIIGGKSPLLTDDITPFQSVSGSGVWSRVASVDDATCQASWNGSELVAKKSNTVGWIEYSFQHKTGGTWKTELRVKNESGLNNRLFGFTQEFDLNRDTIRYGGATRNLDNFDKQIFNRSWLEANEAKVVDLLTGQFFDFDLGFAKLNRVWVNDTGPNQSRLTFEYFYNQTLLLNGQTLIIDPTFGYTNATDNFRVQTNNAMGAACPSASFSEYTGAEFTFLGISTNNEQCIRTGIEWDVSTIPQGATITNVTLQYDVTATPYVSRNCDFTELNARASTGNATAIWEGIGNSTVYVSNDSSCTTISNDKVEILGDIAERHLQNKVGNGTTWFGLGIKLTNETRDGNNYGQSSGDTFELQVEYQTSPPNPPTNLSCTSFARQMTCSWTAPVNATDITGYYMGRSLDNATFTNQTSIANGTSLADSNYWRIDQLYYVNLTSTISGTLNSTTAAFTSFTMDDIPTAPQDFERTNLNASITKLNWNTPSSDGNDPIIGYRVETSAGIWCNSWALLDNLTTSLNYNHTGINENDQYCYRVAAWNGVGLSEYTQVLRRFLMPDAVTNLSLTARDSDSIDLLWSQPNLHGEALQGYRLNYTTPNGTPATILVNNTNSSAVAYVVSGLTEDTQYSFRVGPWTRAGTNGSGNVLDASTFGLANFTIGFLDVNVTNPDMLGIWFSRVDNNATASTVNVIYPNAYDLACDIEYAFAQTNRTYTNLANTTYNSDRVQSAFTFTDPGNEVIEMTCWDQNTNDTGRYVLTQDNFLLLDLIADFRAGEFGTDGFIGAVDVVTLIAVILVMIGFNRLSESVGVIFSAVMIGVLGYFEILTFPETFLPALAVVIMLAIFSTRKD